jgi:hypothetical protein
MEPGIWHGGQASGMGARQLAWGPGIWIDPNLKGRSILIKSPLNFENSPLIFQKQTLNFPRGFSALSIFLIAIKNFENIDIFYRYHRYQVFFIFL